MIGSVNSILYRRPGCVLSLLLASPLALLLLIHPAVMLDGAGSYNHAQLMLVMWGISAGFIHGVGFVPQHWLWRLLFHPAAAWLLMGQGYLMLLPDGAPGLVSG